MRWLAYRSGLALIIAAPIGGSHLYLAMHPNEAISLPRWLAMLYDIGIWAWVIVLAVALGQRINRALHIDAGNWLERAIYSLGSGLGILSLLYTGVAFSGLTSVWTVDSLWVGLTVWLRRDLLRLCRDAFSVKERSWSGKGLVREHGYIWMAVGCALAGLAEVSLIGLTPPTNYDALMYHMEGPQFVLATHHLAVVPAVAQLNFPMGLDILWLPCLALGSDVAAHLLATSFVLFAALAVLVMGQRLAGRLCGWLSATFFVLQPVILVSAGYVAADVGLAFFCALAIGALLRAWEAGHATPTRVGAMSIGPSARGWSWLLASGLYAGLALSVKYTALAVVIMVAGAAVFVPLKGPGLLARMRALIIVGGTATIVGAPWYLKNGIALGNPFYPFHAQALISLVWNSVASRFLTHSEAQTGRGTQAGTTVASLASGPGHSLADLIHLPLTLLLHQEVFTLLYPSLVFILCVLALPVALWRGAAAVRLLALFTLGGLIFWALGVWELRYAFTIFPALSLVGGWAMVALFSARNSSLSAEITQRESILSFTHPASRSEGVATRPSLPSIVGQYMIVGVCALSWLAAVNGLQQVHHILPSDGQSPIGYLLGTESRDAYIAANVDQYPAVTWMNAHLPPDAPIAYLWDERSYLSTAHNITFLPRDTSFPPRLSDKRAMSTWLKSWGQHYLFVDAAMLHLYVQVYSADNPRLHRYFAEVFDPFSRRYLRLLYTDRTFRVYSIVQPQADYRSVQSDVSS